MTRTLSQIASALGRSDDWVEQLVREGLPYQFVESTRYFNTRQVRDWLVERGYARPEPIILATVKAVATHFGVTPRTVQDWQRDGMPGDRGNYDVDAIATWREAHRGTSRDTSELQERGAAETRLAVAKADKAELELAELAGRLIRVDGPKRVLMQTVHAIRTHLEQFPDRLVELLALDADAKDVVRRSAKVAVADLLRGVQAQLTAAAEELLDDGEEPDDK